MKRKVILTIGLLMLVIGSWAQAQNPTEADYQGFFLKNQNAPDPGIPDTVKVQSKDIPLGTTSFSLQVSLYNDEELGALNLPITWNSSDITCDSISFVGSRFSYVGTKLFSIDNVNQRLQAGLIVILEQYLQPGSGLVYTAYFKVNPGAADQLIDFDSTFYPPGGLFALTLTNGLNMFPQFVRGTVKYGNPPTDPIILLDPPSIGFNAVQGGANPTPQTMTITNVGAGTLNWTATNKSAWLTLNPASGTGNATVTLNVSIASLTVGTYYDTITVADPAATNTPQKVPVTLTVTEPPPVIVLNPTSFTYGVFQGGTLPDDTLSISNGGGGVLNWTMTNSSAWLTLIPTSGSGNADVTLRFNVSSLAVGLYRDTIVVTVPGASNSPRRVIVTLVIQQPSANRGRPDQFQLHDHRRRFPAGRPNVDQQRRRRHSYLDSY